MREILYISHYSPPEQVLHHALLYRDQISVVAPGDYANLLPIQAKLAHDAGLLVIKSTNELTADEFIHDESVKGMTRALKADSSDNSFDYLHAILNETMSPLRGLGPVSPELDELIRDGSMATESVAAAMMAIFSRKEDQFWTHLPLAVEGREARRLHGFGLFSAWIMSLGFAVAEKSRLNTSGPLIIPCFADELARVARDCRPGGDGEHLLARVDVGNLLPQPPVGVDTNVLIKFRERYEDERRRLIRAVERLVKDAARAHGRFQLADIERDVREELDQAMLDLNTAGRSVFGGMVRRAAWFTVASSAGSVAGPVGAAAGSVAANWASNPVSRGGKGSDYTYLYRVQGGLEEFNRTAG